jgi:hypothetical protein
MAYDSSWITPTGKNIADIWGLDPAAAAKQRGAQSDAELSLARIRNLDADTSNKPFEREHVMSQTEQQRALTGKTKEETTGLSMKNEGLRQLSQSLARTITDWNKLTPEEQAIAQDQYKAAEGYVLATGGGGNIKSSDLGALVATKGFNPNPTQEQLTTAGQYRGYSRAFPGAGSDTSPQDLVAENKLSAEISNHITSTHGNVSQDVRDYLVKETRKNLKSGVDVQSAYRQALAGLFGANKVNFEDQIFFGEDIRPVGADGKPIPIPSSTVAGAISGAGAPRPASQTTATPPAAPVAPSPGFTPRAPYIPESSLPADISQPGMIPSMPPSGLQPVLPPSIRPTAPQAPQGQGQARVLEMPSDPSQLVEGSVYNTPRGPAVRLPGGKWRLVGQ